MGKSNKTKAQGAVVISKDPSDFQAALTVSDRATLENVRLVNCHCEHRRFVALAKKNCVIDHHAEGKLDEEASRVIVMVNFKLDLAVPSEEGEPFATLIATFLLVYVIGGIEGITAESVRHFAETNGLYNAWPYWREFVQNTAARMSLPGLTVPVLRLGRPQPRPSALPAETTALPETHEKRKAVTKRGHGKGKPQQEGGR